MSRRNTAPRFAVLSLALAACSGPAMRDAPVDVQDQLASLEAETGHPWSMRLGTFGTPAILEGQTAPLAVSPGDAERAARAFIGAHKPLFVVGADELATVTAATQRDGTTHATFQQRHGALPVFGRMLLVHFDANGCLVRVNGRYGPITIPTSLEPVFTSDRARVEAGLLARFSRPTLDDASLVTRTPELVLFPAEPTEPGAPSATRLAWHVEADAAETSDRAPVQLEALFDAVTGEVLLARDRVAHALGSGVGVFGDRKPLSITQKRSGYWLEDVERGDDSPTRTFSNGGRYKLPGSELRSSEADVWDAEPEHGAPGAAVDAHAYVAVAWDWFLRTQGRAGFQDDGAGVRAVVHYGDHVGDAFYDGKQLVFGDGNRVMYAPSAALDIVAHEYAHGVLAATAGLDPDGEPGAVAEGLADAFACLVAYDSGQGAVWQIGEVVHHVNGRHLPVRDLADPQATGQPVVLGEVGTLSDPHVAASIVGHLAYLLVEGSPLGVHALGTDVVGHILYRTATTYLFPTAGFAELTDALLAATRDVAPTAEDDVRVAIGLLGLR